MATITCALAPAYVVRWHYGPYPTTLLETAILATLVAFAVETGRGRQPLEWRTPLVAPALLFILAGAISVLAAPSRVAALGLYRAYLIEPIAFAFVLMHVVSTARRALLLLLGFAAAGVVVGIANAIVVVAALHAHTYDVIQTPPVVIYTTANALALFLGPLIAVAASLFLHGTGRTVRIMSGGFLLVAVPSMLLSFSRGGYLAMAAVAVGLALSHRRRLWLLVATLVAGALVAFIPPIFHRLSVEFQNVGGTTFFGRAGRLELWSATLQMLRHYPIFGAGLSGFADRVAPYWNANHPERFIDPHNIVLNFWVETGLLGLFAFGWLLVAAFRLSWQGWRGNSSDWRPIFLGILLALVAIVIHGLVDVPYFKNDLSLEFWALAGILLAGSRMAMPKVGVTSAAARGTGPSELR
ncbi:MAG: O-antigen ligase family protein [Candidatus Dormibacteraceae bacterium]